MKRPVIVVHGGAWYVPDRLRDDYREGCRAAALHGWEILRAGGTALDAVEGAVRILEDDPTYDAGTGSYFNLAGEIELDAIIVDGRTLNFGAVAAVRQVQHPISLARKVMELEAHNFIVGRGAEALAEELGITRCHPDLLQGRYEDPDDEETWAPPGLEIPAVPGLGVPSDTVGAVALDLAGDFAVATSTGGTPNKRPGRVGDSPLIGSGAYADNRCGAAGATGWGEKLMRIVTSKTACDYLAQGLEAQEAAEAVIGLLEERVAGYGGVILIDREGQVGLAHNTPNLSYAYILPDGAVVAGTEI